MNAEFWSAVAYVVVVLIWTGVITLAYALGRRRREQRLMRENAVLKRDQQPHKPRGATVAELVELQHAHRRNHGDQVDVWGMDSQESPRGRAS